MELYKIKEYPIRNYLASNGIFPSIDKAYYGMYLSPLREECTPSMKVDYNKNLWIDYGMQVGGSVIDMVMQFERCSFVEAVAKLEAYCGGWSPPAVEHRQQPKSVRATMEPGITILKCKPLNNIALLSYLESRCIDTRIASLHCCEVYYRIGEKRYFAVGFANDSGGYELRNRYFKGSNTKDITTIRTENDVCLVFEGFMDYLSYLTLEGIEQCAENVIVLNSASKIKTALPCLSNFREVHSYLDNDKSGQRAFDILSKNVNRLIRKSDLYVEHKDLNEYLCHRKYEPP